jgi:hypothetical protein
MIVPIRVALAVAALALAAGCSSSGITHDDPVASPPPTGPGVLVVRLSQLGGMLPAGGAARRPPNFSLYGDGRLISTPPDDGTQVWPDLAEHRVDAATMNRLYQEAVSASRPVSSPDPQVPDGPALSVTVADTGGQPARTASFSGLADRAVKLLSDFNSAAQTGTGTPYRPDAVAVIALSAAGGGAAERPWPLAGTLPGQPLRGVTVGAGCTLLRGASLTQARQAVAGVTPSTLWRSGGQLWAVAFRPLLPDEPGCGAL